MNQKFLFQRALRNGADDGERFPSYAGVSVGSEGGSLPRASQIAATAKFLQARKSELHTELCVTLIWCTINGPWTHALTRHTSGVFLNYYFISCKTRTRKFIWQTRIKIFKSRIFDRARRSAANKISNLRWNKTRPAARYGTKRATGKHS